MQKPFQRIVLPNGMRVIFIPEPQSVAATVLVMVEAGSKYETKEISGLSHFLEHMCFKGTKDRPKAIDIAGELDGMGAEYNAFTSQEWTGYYVKVEKNRAEKALEVIADLYLNPLFDEAEIEKEKGVVIEELNMYEDLPQRKVNDIFMELLYGDQPAGWDIGGNKEIIQTLTREQLLAYRNKHYVASATSIVIAGAFDEKLFLKKIETLFASLSNGEKHSKVKTIEHQENPAILLRHKKSDQTHLVLGLRAFPSNDGRRFALDVLADVLGGGMSSRLFQRVREELGAAYYVRAGADLYSDHGYLAVASGVDIKKIDAVVSAIVAELERLTKELIPEDEFRRSKDHLIGKVLLGFETSDALAMYYGGQEVLREPLMSPEELKQKLESVTREEVMAVAKDIISNEKLNLAVIGPLEDKSSLAHILKFN
ncbi:MAG: pitrilysin family protein [Patescibacteria group bacterium]